MGLKTVRVPEVFRSVFERAEKTVSQYFDSMVQDPTKGTIVIGEERYLLVRAGGNSYGLKLDQVIEVVDGFEVSLAPSVHPSVRGVTQLRGKSVPLVHLASLIANAAAPLERHDTAVLGRCAGSHVAFEIDDADAVTADEQEAVPDAWQLPWVHGVVRKEGTIVPVIDLDVLGERLTSGVERVQE